MTAEALEHIIRDGGREVGRAAQAPLPERTR
jgi:hypothetical protein